MSPEQRSDQEWLADLRSEGTARNAALADLRALLVQGLRHALRGWMRTSGKNFDSMSEDFVQEALLRILENLDSFEGRSRFTTWAHKIAVRVALTELRRKRWQDISLDLLLQSGNA